jgi:CxxC motif-containing protein (DUF1111 family)
MVRRADRVRQLARAATPFAMVAVLVATGVWPLPGRSRATAADPGELVARGAVLFATTFTPARGLGPLFNHTGCVGCHVAPTLGGMGPDGLGTATRVGQLTAAGFDPLLGYGGPVARTRSVAELGLPCDLAPGIPPVANITSVRNAPGLYGSGLIDRIPDAAILAGAVPRSDGIHGRAHRVRGTDGQEHIGRFGWKADTASLRQFVADAFRNELGITSPLAPADILVIRPSGRPPCTGESAGIEDDGSIVEAVTAFLAALPPPTVGTSAPRGALLFAGVGCAACHTPSLPVGDLQVPLYSDLLLHDVGSDLDDKVVQGQAGGRDWRTTPLWGLRARPRLLHDGRARTVLDAVLAHGGEAEPVLRRFRQLTPEDRGALLAFLAQL